MASNIPKLSLNNGHKIPQIGLGTWKAQPSLVTKVIQEAIELGYRHIDCALFYQNEKDIGKGLAAKLAEKKVGRKDLFITSKLWNTHHRPDFVEPAIKKTLTDLRLSYLNLYLMHWPMAYRTGNDLVPKDKNTGKVAYSKIDFLDTWKAMEDLVKSGFTRSIGLGNFNKRQICRLLDNASICPVVNQVECHPYLNQQKLIDFCRSKDIVITCYSPLGSPDRPWAKPNDPILLKDPEIEQIAKKHSRTPAQVLLRYQIQRCNVVIPKSMSRKRLAENLCIFNFKLESGDMKKLNSLHTGKRFVELREDSENPEYPFANESVIKC